MSFSSTSLLLITTVRMSTFTASVSPSLSQPGSQLLTYLTGRTGRIGNTGLATSFYNDRDEPMASFITKVLLETNQPVPEFFKEYMPEDMKPDFDDDSAGEESGDEGGADGDGDAWGSGGGDEGATAAPAADDAWGNGNGAATDRPWGNGNGVADTSSTSW